MKRNYFGTDGVRGPYGGATMNEAFAWRLGVAVARFTRERRGAAPGRVLIGRDTRASGPSLERSLAAGLRREQMQPATLGVVPSPVVSLLTRSEGAVLGVVITASHNPATDNGIKFFGPDGIKLTDEEEARIESLLPGAGEVPASGLAAEVGLPGFDPLARYLELAVGLVPPGSLTGWPVVLDTANGAACVSSRTALERLGARVELIGNTPDGTNINAGVGSQHPELMCAAVPRLRARLGIAHDGDADRCILCDEKGEVLDGDEMLTLLALHGLRHGTLANQTLVITVQSNLGVDAAVQAAGGRVARTAVGDRYVIERMQAEHANLGGESSGHVICSDISPTGDGLVAALRVVAVMLATGQPLSELRRGLKKFPQLTAALTVQEKKPLETLPTVSATIAQLTAELGARGRLLVRYSGTEPKLRLLVEGPTDAIVRDGLDRLEAAVRKDLVVVE